MYDLSQLKSGMRHPNLILREFNRYYHLRLYTRRFNTAGVDVIEEDWDNLLILDACRYDAFASESSLPGELERKRSGASETVGFLKYNFRDRDLHDTVYVTANPQLARHWDDIRPEFHNVVNVWEDDGWDDELGTVRPQTTTEYAMQVANEYPHKRIIVHYIQPHYPFLDPESTFDKGHLEDDQSEEGNLWYRKMWGELDVSAERLWELYIATLRKTLPHVEDLMESLSGRTVVTADHGNMFGERSFPIPIREWGHPHSTFTDELVTVPWLIDDRGERRSISAEEPVTRDRTSVDEDVASRLDDLGYKG